MGDESEPLRAGRPEQESVSRTALLHLCGGCLLWKLNQKGISDILVVDHLADSLKWRNLVGKDFSDYIEKDDFLKLVCEEKLDKNVQAIVHLGACTSTTCIFNT